MPKLIGKPASVLEEKKIAEPTVSEEQFTVEEIARIKAKIPKKKDKSLAAFLKWFDGISTGDHPLQSPTIHFLRKHNGGHTRRLADIWDLIEEFKKE